MSYREVKQLPIRAFWLMSANINRLMAERGIRDLEIASIATNGGDELPKLRDRLVVEMGELVKMDPQHAATNAEKDPDAIDRLRGLRSRLR